MALVNCPECNASVSDTASSCPSCGCAGAGRKGSKIKPGSGLVLLSIFVSIPLMIWLMDKLESVPLAIGLAFIPVFGTFIYTAIRG